MMFIIIFAFRYLSCIHTYFDLSFVPQRTWPKLLFVFHVKSMDDEFYSLSFQKILNLSFVKDEKKMARNGLMTVIYPEYKE